VPSSQRRWRGWLPTSATSTGQWQEGVIRVERAFSYGRVKPLRTKASRRRVPLDARAADALASVPPRLDSRLVFPGPRGTHIDLRN
jgi:integrase